MKFFCLLGSLSVMCLFFFTGPETLWVALTFTILASIGFWGSMVFYNAYLPEVAFPEQQDKVSAQGFIYGYIGSVLLLVFSLVMVEKARVVWDYRPYLSAANYVFNGWYLVGWFCSDYVSPFTKQRL